MSAGSVVAARSVIQQAGGGANPTPALQTLLLLPIAVSVARQIIERNHYLHSMPGGTCLAFGVFFLSQLLGALTLGVGPFNGHSLVKGAIPED